MTVNQCVFLVGGRGTRLGAWTDNVPKPLLPVGGRPFIEYLIENAVRHGFRDILLLAGYRGTQVEDLCAASRWPGASIRCVVEPSAAGTAGALVGARDYLADCFVLINGDTLFDINLLDLTQVPAEENWVGCLALRGIPDGSRYGVVSLGDNHVLGFCAAGSSGPGTIYGGICLLRRTILNWIEQSPCSLEHDVFPRLASAGALFGRAYEAPFIDIGVPQTLASSQTEVPGIVRRPAAFLDRDGVLNRDLGYVHKVADFAWNEGAKQAVKLLNDRGYYVFVVTNQAGVAHGYYPEDAVYALHEAVNADLRCIGAHIDEFFHCPHHPNGAVDRYRMVCACRKPSPGMLNAAMTRWPIDQRHSFLIGDKPIDMEAAQAAGMPGYLFAGGDLAAFMEEIVSVCWSA